MSIAKVKTLPRIGWSSAGIRMTGADFDAITDYDDRFRYELIDGVLVVNPIPLEAEAGPNDELGHLVLLYQHQHPQGSALDGTLPERYIQTTPNTRRRADRVIWAGLGRQPDPEVDVPTVAVEFVSKGKRSFVRDYEEKRQEYAAVGIVEYWLIDRFRRIMTVYRNVAGSPTELIIQENEVYKTALLPGFELPVAYLLAVADRWKGRPKRKH